MCRWIWMWTWVAACSSEIELRGDIPAGDPSSPVDLGSEESPAPDTPTTPTTDTDVPPSACASWRDTLPPLPPPVALPANLPAGAGVALANCTGDPVRVTDPEAFQDEVRPSQEHVGGQWYFEAQVTMFEPDGSEITVFASPSSSAGTPGLPQGLWARATHVSSGLGVYGVAVDLDAGHVGFYQDGVLVSEADVSLDPGVGAFTVAGLSKNGNELQLNFGSEPFVHDPPAGYAAWSSSAAGGGWCPSDPSVPAPPAPVDLSQPEGRYSTFLSDATADTELVMLSTYDSGSVSVGDDDQPGAITVEFNRPGPTELALITFYPCEWTIVPGPDSDIQHIYVYAMYSQSVVGVPAGIPVDTYYAYQDGLFFPVAEYWWPYVVDGSQLQALVDMVEQQTCLPLKVFAGTYETQHIVVN